MSDLTPRGRFHARLLDRPLLADGGMGTLLFSRGVPQRACLDELAATRPELVGGAHREYLEAGAELIVTLSLGANRHRLEGFGLADRVRQLNRRAAQVARDARDVAGRDALVGGSIGPLGVPTHELAGLGETRARALFREQIDALLEGGIDVFVLETHPDLETLLWAVDEARRAADLPILASLTFGEELTLPDGSSPGRCRDRPRRRPAWTSSASTAAQGRPPVSTPSRHSVSPRRAGRRARSCPTPGCPSASRDASSTRRAPTTLPR